MDFNRPGTSHLAIAVVVVLVAACGSQGPTLPPPSASASALTEATSSGPSDNIASSSAATDVPPAALTIFGASSLADALGQLKTTYEDGHPGASLTIRTDSSSALETQIEGGARADVFLSADVGNSKKLIDGGLADGPAIDFAGNLLTIVVPTANPAKIASPADLARSGVRIIAADDAVPITTDATQVVGLLARLDGYPAGFASAYAANIVAREPNVGAVIGRIERGEGDAALVYVTDAKASSRVATIGIPAQANVPVTYVAVVVKASPHVAAAHAFLDWLQGAEAQLILTELGFIQPQT